MSTTTMDELLFGKAKSHVDLGAKSWTAATDLQDAISAFRPSAMKFVDDPKLLDIEDVRDAFRLMNADRIQPEHTVRESSGPGAPSTQCLYAAPDTGRPSCIAGTIISILAPDYFAQIKGDLTGLKSLLGLKQRFTQRAIDLMFRMQKYADGAMNPERIQCTWGEAFHEAALDQLSGL